MSYSKKCGGVKWVLVAVNILVPYKLLRYWTPYYKCLRLLHLEAVKKKKEGCDIFQLISALAASRSCEEGRELHYAVG